MWPGKWFQTLFNFQGIFWKKESEEVNVLFGEVLNVFLIYI